MYLVGEKALTDGVQGFRSRHSGTSTGLNFSDFIYLFISDIDKTTTVSLRYWFRCYDLDGNGVLTQCMLERIYKNQYDRLIVANKDSNGRIDLFNFNQMMHLLLDKLNPANRQAITIDDFITYPDQLLDGGHFFNGLGNMGRYVLHEDRSLLDRKTRQEAFLTGNGLSDWDRFAMITYTQYARSTFSC